MRSFAFFAVAATIVCPAQAQPARIDYGSALNAQSQVSESRRFGKQVAAERGLRWNTKGDQRRTYTFRETGVTIPYRLYVPETWDGRSKLSLIVMLHGGGSDENRYLDLNDGQLLRLAAKHGYLLVSPLG
jgi:poly(3-hydroxybutyrate) depolymerase